VEKRFSTNLKTMAFLDCYIFCKSYSFVSGWFSYRDNIRCEHDVCHYRIGTFAAAYSLYGGLSAVAWTDVIQVIFLVLGGLVTTYLALNTVSDGAGMWEE
jgi:SSS family solute:Na+ symporter